MGETSVPTVTKLPMEEALARPVTKLLMEGVSSTVTKLKLLIGKAS